LFVIARNSSFAFKNQSLDVKTVARELGVRYMLEGSVRRMGNRLRINAQLLDTEMATHIWAERYDGELTDVFELQDEITRSIVGSIAPQIEIAEVERSRALSNANLSSYELSLKAQAIFYDCAREGNPELRQETIEAAQAALDIDPRNTLALWIQGYSYLMQYLYRWSANPEECLDRAQDISQRLLQADSSNPRAYMTRAMISTFRGEYDAAIADFRRAFDLNPNFALNLIIMAWGESLAGMTADAKHHAELALRLSPRDLDLWLGDAYLALLQANFAESDFVEAKRWGLLAIQMTPKAPIRLALMAASCVHTNDSKGAAHYAQNLAKLSPDFIPSLLSGAVTLYKMPEHNFILTDGLRKGGFE
jgi:tetratricopeptide (TPR) repeat protein